MYFDTEFDYHLHSTFMLQICAYQREIDRIARKLAKLDYSIDKNYNLQPNYKVDRASSKTERVGCNLETQHFNEDHFRHQLLRGRKRLEKVKRQFAAFNLK